MSAPDRRPRAHRAQLHIGVSPCNVAFCEPGAAGPARSSPGPTDSRPVGHRAEVATRSAPPRSKHHGVRAFTGFFHRVENFFPWRGKNLNFFSMVWKISARRPALQDLLFGDDRCVFIASSSNLPLRPGIARRLRVSASFPPPAS